MATSGLYSEHLTCSICRSIFTDPVTLICGHSFCRHCITDDHSVNKGQQCPLCWRAIPAEGTCLQTNHILKDLSEKAKEGKKMMKTRMHEKAEVTELCPEHKEKLKMFCVTGQQLVCTTCSDGEKHEGHKFTPVKEAAALLRKKLEKFGQRIADDINATERLANTQMQGMANTVDKAQQLRTQVSRQFREMHHFLRRREDEIKNDLKHKEENDLEEMSDTLNTIETVMSESRVLEAMVASVLEITDSERFIKSWTENNGEVTPEHLFRPRASELQVVNASLSLGPYESHLQFFMWKEMLQVVQPRAELLSLKTNSTNITISDDRRSLISTPKSTPTQSSPIFDHDLINRLCQTMTPSSFCTIRAKGQNMTAPSFGSFREFAQTLTPPSGALTNHASSVNEFSSGQYYWEIDVGHRHYWELGIKDNFLKCNDRKYSTCSLNVITELSFTGRPRKIGIYLDLSSKKLTFYNADNMSLIYTLSCRVTSSPLSAHFNIRYRTPDPNPMTVCWY
ncbi:zinc-binding protein A33 [Pleuronectes platessa]|uniref:zinc-binding protein A33 n=1 Tax=Pleuronectes platessa TaxID=8262 RepID=UPI00232A1366|nr:zinc-binding protein A33 [Pleuronectes platessa]